jgi:uncharacterized protein YqjF (DUF2071 family)
MTWSDLLFAHWPLAPAAVQAMLPRPLQVETRDGIAWIGVVPFRMSGVRLRFLPPIPTTGDFPELNVRTYVRCGNQSGVYFFTLDAASRLAVLGGRMKNINYLRADMSCSRRGGSVEYTSVRTHRGAPGASFSASYGPIGEAFAAAPGGLERWLTERYVLLTVDARGRAWRVRIDHPPWDLHRAAATIGHNTMTHGLGLGLPDIAPHVLFGGRLDVRAMAPERIA